jgi:endonuclease/exonuclease/phosphatase family metal-dependent hydrolase
MKAYVSVKAFCFVNVVALFCCSLSLFAQYNASVNVLTYNIRYANPDDAPNTWAARKAKVFNLIQQAEPDVFGLQEALKGQVADIETAFKAFTRIGVGRDNGKDSGEYSPIFYKTKKYNLHASGSFWLSQTPSQPGSLGWDAACNRVVTWIHLEDRKTGNEFFVFCTHFDHKGQEARRNSAKLLIDAVDSLSAGLPVIVLGDFNASPVSEPYQLITYPANPLHLIDARTICAVANGPDYTYTGFKVDAIQGERIDYIFLKGITLVDLYSVNPENNGEYYPSDHLPVSAVLRFI